MSRNRFTTGNENVNRFRSNLMLICQNLYVDGLPIPKLRSEYNKYFGDEINPDSLFADLKLRLLRGKEDLACEIEKWSKIFNSPSLYEFFEVVSKNDIGPVLICKRGRTMIEMKAMAQLASFDNIELVRSNGLTNNTSPSTAALSLCQSCWDVIEPDDNFNSDRSRRLLNKRPRRMIRQVVVESKKMRFFQKISNLNESTQATLIQGTSSEQINSISEVEANDNEGEVVTKSEVAEVSKNEPRADKNTIQQPITMDDKNAMIEESDISIVNNSVVIDAPTRSTKKNPKKLSKCRDLNSSKLASCVLTNHRGEVKVVKYMAEDEKCDGCKKSFADLASHRSCCPALTFPCKKCNQIFKTKTQLRGHIMGTHQTNSRTSSETSEDEIIVKYEVNVSNMD